MIPSISRAFYSAGRCATRSRSTALVCALALVIALPTAGQTQSGSSALDDPVAPDGATIGAKLSDVEGVLIGAGYKKTWACNYRKAGGGKNTINVTLRAGQHCAADAPVYTLSYTESAPSIVETPRGIVERFSRRLGVEADCLTTAVGLPAHLPLGTCTWPSPPMAPLVKQVKLVYSNQGVVLTLTGVDELAASGSSVPSKAESSLKRPDTAAKSGGAPREGRFDIEGVQLGMTPAQVAAILGAKGFVPTAKQTLYEGKTAVGPGTISVKYLPLMKPHYPVEQAHWVTLTYPRAPTDRELQRHPLYERLTAEYGNPDKCITRNSCSWVRPAAGWEETLDFQLSGSGKIVVWLRARIADRAKFSQLAADSTMPSSPVSPPAPSSASAPPPSPVEHFDALAPHGIRVGMPYSEVPPALKTAGFKDIGGGCRWLREKGPRVEEISIKITGQRLDRCEGAAPVERMEYGLYDSKGLDASPESYIARMNKQFGMDAKCTGRPKLQKFNCKWMSPPNAPYAREISANLSPGRIYYQIHPKQDTALLRSPSSTAKADVPSGDQFWWTQELAKADATGLGKQFAQGEQFKQLPADRQTLLSEQAATVYNYCKGREPFSSLHNCSCVADKFVDARMKAWTEKPAPRPPAANCASGDQGCLFRAKNAQEKWEMEEKMRERRMNDNSQTTVIGLADKEAHQCPSKAGVADYSYKQCITNYRHRMASPDDLRALCTCYADTSATNYMKDPRASFNTLVGAGAGALLECKRQGVPSPLPR